MLIVFKNVIKKLPGIRRVVQGRDRFIQLYQEEVIHSNQLFDETKNLQQIKVRQAEEIEKCKEQQCEKENQIEQLKNCIFQKEKQLNQLNYKK